MAAPSPSSRRSIRSRTLAALDHPGFRRYFFGQGISLVGTWLQSAAVRWVVYEQSRSEFKLGVIELASLLPGVVVGLFAGALADRIAPLRMIVLMECAQMALAFLLMSTMSPSTSAVLQSLYLFILGAGIGSCMQVLVLIVQNTSRFEDLGVATSGVTFFRTIGSSFGAAIFGSLFTNFLRGRIGPAIVVAFRVRLSGDLKELGLRLADDVERDRC